MLQNHVQDKRNVLHPIVLMILSLALTNPSAFRLKEDQSAPGHATSRMGSMMGMPAMPVMPAMPSTVPEPTDEEKPESYEAAPVKKPPIGGKKMGFGMIDFGAVKLRSSGTLPKSPTTASPVSPHSSQSLKSPTSGSSSTKKYGFGGVNQFIAQPQVQSATLPALKRTSSTKKGFSTASGSDADRIKELMIWVQGKTAGYKNVHVTNFTTSFKDGLAFCAIIHKSRPGSINFDSLDPNDAAGNLKLAFDTAERMGVPRLLSEEDILDLSIPERLSIITYVLELRKVFH